jgi:hypothetical protein
VWLQWKGHHTPLASGKGRIPGAPSSEVIVKPVPQIMGKPRFGGECGRRVDQLHPKQTEASLQAVAADPSMLQISNRDFE